MFKVINRFREDGHTYEIGKTYPKSGKATKKRLTELSEIHPKHKRAFIEQVEEEAPKEEVKPKKKKE